MSSGQPPIDFYNAFFASSNLACPSPSEKSSTHMKENIHLIEVTRGSDCTLTDSSKVIPASVNRTALYEKFKSKIIYNPSLNRTLVSFQANKQLPFYGWFKYREGFSEPLVTYLGNIERYRGVMLGNRTSILFSSEPDISLVGN